MSTLTILVIIVAGVAVAYLLEEWSERSHARVFTPQNWFGPAPEGSWTETTASEYGFWFEILFIMLFVWLLTNTKLVAMSVTYLIFLIFYTFIWATERMNKKLKYVAVLGPGKLGEWPRWMAVGAPIGVFLGLLANATGQIATGQVVQFEGMPLMWAWLIVGLAIPATEEQIIRGVALPTAAEDIGIVGALLFQAVFFSSLHWVLFGPQMLVMSFVFSLVAGLVALSQRSFVPAAFMHIAYNSVVIIIASGLLGG